MPVSGQAAHRPLSATQTSPGQASVWDHPLPPRLEQTPRCVRVVLDVPAADVLRDSIEAVPGIGSVRAFHVGQVDACFVDDELARPQPDSFYAGWFTPDVIGPFKGAERSEGW